MEKLKELLKKPYVWIALVGIVALVLFLRARRGAGAGGPIREGQPQGGGGGGFGGGGGAPAQSPQDLLQQQLGYQQAQLALQTGQQQLDYEKRLQNLQLQGLGSQLEYQQAGQKLQEQYQQGLLPSRISLGQAQLGTERAQEGVFQSQLGAQQHYLEAVQKAQVSCPGTASMRIDPTTGAPYCRQKTSGNILGIPVGGIFRTGQGVVQGAQAYAPQAGYNLAQAGTQYFTSRYLTSPVAPGGAGLPAATGQTGGQGPSYGTGPSTRAPQPYDAGLSAPSPMRQRMV